jgi:GT2 family glycosyltransferase
MRNVHIGLVTVLYNSDDVLEDFFRSLSIQSFKDFTLFIVDNSYNEDSFELINVLLEKHDLTNRSIYIDSGSNVGIAEGNNIGIRKCLEAGLEYTLLLNNDIFFNNENLLITIVQETITNNFMLASLKIYYYKTNKIWFVDGCFDIYKTKVKHLYDGIEDVGQFESIVSTEYAPTCFMIIKSEIFNQIGLMDSSYFVYMDDVDFVYRASNFGYSVYILPNLYLYHKVGSSTGGQESEFSFKYSLRNRIYFARKFHSHIIKTVTIGYLLLAFLFKALKYDRVKIYYEALREGFSLKINS